MGRTVSLQAAASSRHISIEEGLSSRLVYQVCKDSAGFVWVYTHVGVDRYDGNEIKHYQLPENTESNIHILSFTVMNVDRKGQLWVAHRDGKIYSYDARKDDFVLRIDLQQYVSQPILTDVMFEGDDGLWLCLSSDIYYFSFQENSLSRKASLNEWVNCLVKGEGDSFFVGTATGVYRLLPKEGTSEMEAVRISLPVERRIESLFVYANKLYVGTFSHGVYVVDLANGNVQALGEAMMGVPIRTFVHSDEHAILVGTDGSGVFSIDDVTGEILKHYNTNEKTGAWLKGNTVSDICVDEEGGIWVSTSTNGLCFLNLNVPQVYRERHERNSGASLIADHVNVLMQDSEGDYWYGTNEGVSLYRVKDKRWVHFLNGQTQAAVVLALCEDSDGHMWAGGYGIGLYCIDKRSERVTKMPIRKQEGKTGVSTEHIYSILSDGDCLWAGGIEGELFCYNRRTGQYLYYPLDCVGDLEVYDEHRLFIAGCSGLGVFNKVTGAMEWRTQFGDTTLRYPVRCLLRSSTGELWMATDGDGLVRFNPVTEESRIYTTADGISSNSINSMVEDNHGYIWFNTEKELYCLDLSDEQIVAGNELLDIAYGYYNANAAMKTQDGVLAFGTAEGVLGFFPTFDFSRDVEAKLLFTDFRLPYESVKPGEPGSPLEECINATKKLRLRFKQNSFTIGFSAINLASSRMVRYEYRLKNYEEQWHRVDKVQHVSYMDIPSGTYVFQLRAFDKYTQRQIGERSLQITVDNPFWLSWWAMLVYMLLAGVLVYLLVLFRRQKAREERVKEKINSFISIAHDIRTPVSLIKAPLSELASIDDLSEECKKNVDIATKNVNKLFSMITQLLDLQKVELDSESLKVVKYDIKAYLEEKLAEFRLASIQKGVDMSLTVEEDMPEVWIDREKMDHILDNLLSNALKYTHQGAVHILVRTRGKHWQVIVSDTGIGIPKDEQHNIFHEYFRARNTADLQDTGTGLGLLITRRIVKQHHGSISFDSVEGRGTTFTVTFPLKMKENLIADMKEEAPELMAVVEPIRQAVEDDKKNVLLLAEDDVDMRDYLTESLSAEYKVVSVPDGGKALELARELNPDIIISDIVMPVLEGDELCRILKGSLDTSHIPIILLTALSEREKIIQGLESGANDYIIKPFDLAVLKVRIRNILRSRQQLRDSVLSPDSEPEEEDYASQLDREFLAKVMDVIDGELSNCEFSINDFCRMLAMSRTSVYNKIKTLTGQSPNDFIRIIRLNKSQELLKSRRYTIGEVATMVGFSDPKYFSTCFKKQFGLSPSKV